MFIIYFVLAIAIASCFATKNKMLVYVPAITSLIIAAIYGVVTAPAVISFLAFAAICYNYYHYNILGKLNKPVSFVLIILCIFGFALHLIPGVTNLLVLDKVILSSFSCPYTLYMNFDKVFAALILFIASNAYLEEKRIDLSSIIYVLSALLLCSIIVLPLAILLGYIAFDFTVNNIVWLWAANNLIFVAFSEEVIFRVFLQKQIKSFLAPNKFPYHIVIAAVIFGLAHFPGGWGYVCLATICGLFYGYIYERTSRISCAILLHFGFNLIHFIFFTYPVALQICL